MVGKTWTLLTRDDNHAKTHTSLIPAAVRFGEEAGDREGTDSTCYSIVVDVVGPAFQPYDAGRDYQKDVDLILTAQSRWGMRNLWANQSRWRY